MSTLSTPAGLQPRVDKLHVQLALHVGQSSVDEAGIRRYAAGVAVMGRERRRGHPLVRQLAG
jgi:hypothetical protein